jgi:GT2 family glycosyltransferase
MDRISLYVPCFNGARWIERCLAAIHGQTRPPDEVLVVDDGSTDGSAELARRAGVVVLSHDANRGLGAARNTAVRAARFPLVASLDADCLAAPEWLATLERRLREGSFAGVGGRLVETYQTTLADRWRTFHMRQHWGDRPLDDPPFLFGNNNLFRKAALEAVGLYDERLRTNFEDVSTSEALRAAGHRLAYEPAAVVHHLRTDTLASVIRSNWRWRFFGYRHDIEWRSLLRALRHDRLDELRYFLGVDARHLDAPGALVSCAAVAYAVRSDVSYLLAHRGEPRIHDPAGLRRERARGPASGGGATA